MIVGERRTQANRWCSSRFKTVQRTRKINSFARCSSDFPRFIGRRQIPARLRLLGRGDDQFAIPTLGQAQCWSCWNQLARSALGPRIRSSCPLTGPHTRRRQRAPPNRDARVELISESHQGPAVITTSLASTGSSICSLEGQSLRRLRFQASDRLVVLPASDHFGLRRRNLGPHHPGSLVPAWTSNRRGSTWTSSSINKPPTEPRRRQLRFE